MTYEDNLTYGVLVEDVGGKRMVRVRRTTGDWYDPDTESTYMAVRRYWLMRRNPVMFATGPLGQERVRHGIDADGHIYDIDGSGVPSTRGYMAEAIEDRPC